MASSQIGAQMYTVRHHTRTPRDIVRTCERLRAIGYEAVQVSALGPIEIEELARILRGEGLTCAATHVSLELMRDTNRCVEHHEMLGCRYPAIGGYRADVQVADTYEAFAAEFSAVAGSLAERGLRIGYHNHSRELAAFGDGRRILDILIDRTGPAVWFEIDTYWIAHGGGDPSAWIDRVAGRVPCVHVKDMSVTIDQEQKMCEVGLGNLNWPRILESCRAAGAEWYLVERDDGALDPFESLRISLENLRAMGVQ